MFKPNWISTFVCSIFLLSNCANPLNAGVIPWTYSAIFGPPGSVAQMRSERLAYRSQITPYSASYGYAAGYGYPINSGYNSTCAGCGSYGGGYSVGYSPFDSSNCFGCSPYVSGNSYVPLASNFSSGCSSCTGCSTGSCTGPGCASAVTPAGGLKPQVEPNMVNPSNPRPTPNSNYIDQPSVPNSNTPSTFKDSGFGNSGNTNAPVFVQPENIETKKISPDAAKNVSPESKMPLDSTEMKKDQTATSIETVVTPKESSTAPEKTSEAVEETIKKRQPAPPTLPETSIKNPTLEIPNPAPIANNIPTILVVTVEPTRVIRTAKFAVPKVARSEAKILPFTLQSSVIAQK